MLSLRRKSRGRHRVPPARPRLERRYVERAAYLALVQGRITAEQYRDTIGGRA